MRLETPHILLFQRQQCLPLAEESRVGFGHVADRFFIEDADRVVGDYRSLVYRLLVSSIPLYIA